jgi:FMN phosphatase YigB (HAD superfamily)
MLPNQNESPPLPPSTPNEITIDTLDDTGIEQNIIFNELIKSYKQMKYVSEEIPELINKIRAKGIKVIIATDNMDMFERFAVPAMKLNELFDGVLVSCNLKFMKGDIKNNSIPFFDEYLNKHNLDYKDVVLLDDRIEDKGAYNKLGLQVIQITGHEKLISVLKEFAS